MTPPARGRYAGCPECLALRHALGPPQGAWLAVSPLGSAAVRHKAGTRMQRAQRYVTSVAELEWLWKTAALR